MKNKKNWLAILVIGIFVFTAYMVPSVMAKLEDDHIQSTIKKFEIEEIQLNSTEVDYIETLEVFRELIDSQIVTQEMKEVDASQRDYSMVKESVEKFMQLFDREEIEFIKFQVTSMVMVNLNTDNVYPLFYCNVVDEKDNDYSFWLSALDQMVVAYDIPRIEKAEWYVEKMSKYYGFYSWEVWDEIYSYFENDYLETSIRYYTDETLDNEITILLCMIKDRIGFNLYPSEVSVYDANSQTSG